MTSIPDFINFFLTRTKIKLARMMEFRFDFFSGMFFSFLVACAGPLFQFLIYSRTNGYPGWSFDQILLFQSVLLLWSGLSGTLLGNVGPLITITVRNGLFDRFLLYPCKPMRFLIGSGFGYNSLGTLAAGIIAIVYSLVRLRIVLQWYQCLLFFLFIGAGIVFYAAILILYSSLAIRVVFVGRLFQIIDNFISFGNFPAEIFPAALRIIYLTLVPVALWIYYPAQVLIGRIDNIAFFGILISIVIFLISLIVWKQQLKKYGSAGG